MEYTSDPLSTLKFVARICPECIFLIVFLFKSRYVKIKLVELIIKFIFKMWNCLFFFKLRLFCED